MVPQVPACRVPPRLSPSGCPLWRPKPSARDLSLAGLQRQLSKRPLAGTAGPDGLQVPSPVGCVQGGEDCLRRKHLQHGRQ